MGHALSDALQSLGLQPNEARVYLALSELGRGSVSDISSAAHLNRTTGYDILERLCLYGLASRSSARKKKKIYAAEPPARIKQFLENKRRTAERRLESFPDILPDLEALHKTDLKPVIKFFEGREGIKNIYNHTLEAKGTIYSLLDLEQYLPEFDEFGKEHVKQRVRLGVKEKVLVRKNKAALDFYRTTYKGKKSFQKNTEYRWLEHDFLSSPAAEIMIYDDKVIGVLFKPGENVAFEVQSASFAGSLKALFELVWISAKPLQEK